MAVLLTFIDAPTRGA